jgi:hypothetical protein
VKKSNVHHSAAGFKLIVFLGLSFLSHGALAWLVSSKSGRPETGCAAALWPRTCLRLQPAFIDGTEKSPYPAYGALCVFESRTTSGRPSALPAGRSTSETRAHRTCIFIFMCSRPSVGMYCANAWIVYMLRSTRATGTAG